MNRIRKLREARGLTQTQLGAAIGTTHGTISKLERGELELKADQVRRLARAMRVHPGELFEELPAPRSLRLPQDLTPEQIRAIEAFAAMLTAPEAEHEPA